MNITNIIVIKNLQYFILSAIIIFALLSLIARNIRNKFIFLFSFILFAQIYDFTLYFGELFFLFFIPMILFLIIFYLYDLQNEIYSPGEVYNENIHNQEVLSPAANKKLPLRAKIKKAFSIAMPVLFCAGFIFLFVKFSGNYAAKFNAAKSITLVGFANIANEIFFNYGILIFLVILLIFILFLWIISILQIRKKQ